MSNDRKEFSEKVLEMHMNTQDSYISCISHLCEELNIEYDLVPSLLTAALKAKIIEESEKLNLLKTKTSRLPL